MIFSVILTFLSPLFTPADSSVQGANRTQLVVDRPVSGALQYDLSQSLGFQYPDIPAAWNVRDILLYAVSIGAQVNNQTLLNELDPNFVVFPTYAACLSFKGTSEGWVDFTKGRYTGPIPGLPALAAFPPVQDFQYIEPYKPLPNDSGSTPWTIKKRIIAVQEIVTPTGSNLFLENELVLYDPKGVKYTRLIAATKYLGGHANGVNFTDRIASGLTPKPIPKRHPDYRIKIKVSPIETFIYRLNGDYNQLHVDPKVGAQYGYGGLILHALSYFGFSAFEIVGRLGGGDVASLHSLQGGFGLPVRPGDNLVLQVWEVGRQPEGLTEISYIVKDLSTGKTVIDRAAGFIRKKTK